MKVDGKHYRTIWQDIDSGKIKTIDQRWLPHEFRVVELDSVETVATAIKDMWVRGAPLIGATAAFGMALQMQKDSSNKAIDQCYTILKATRPTAVNLVWALNEMRRLLLDLPQSDRLDAAMQKAHQICDDDVEICRKIGIHGLDLIKQIANKKDRRVNILTHCNAGWLATVDWGTATSPIYHAIEAGLDIHVWVDETRPRNQGAHLTAWELLHHGVPNTLIVDNAGGHLMQNGEVDLVIVGTDRTTASGDVCNKIGTYLKALAAYDNHIPFYVALPSPTIDWTIKDGLQDIPIEEREQQEVSNLWGKSQNGEIKRVQISPQGTNCANPAFDVTPARYVTGLITERGICKANPEALADMFPDLAN